MLELTLKCCYGLTNANVFIERMCTHSVSLVPPLPMFSTQLGAYWLHAGPGQALRITSFCFSSVVELLFLSRSPVGWTLSEPYYFHTDVLIPPEA